MHSQVSLSELTDAQLEAPQNFTNSLLVDATQD